jgi:hypothetical protein
MYNLYHELPHSKYEKCFIYIVSKGNNKWIESLSFDYCSTFNFKFWI